MTSIISAKHPSRKSSLEPIQERQEESFSALDASVLIGNEEAASTAKALGAEDEVGPVASTRGETFVHAITRMLKRNQSWSEPFHGLPSSPTDGTTDSSKVDTVKVSDSAGSDVRLPFDRFRKTLSPSTRTLLASLRWTVEPENECIVSPLINPVLRKIDPDICRSSLPTRSSSWTSTPSPRDPHGDIVWPGRLSCPATATAAAIPSPSWPSDGPGPSTVTRDSSLDSVNSQSLDGVPLSPRWGPPASTKSHWDPKDETNPNSTLFFPYAASPPSLPEDFDGGDGADISTQWEKDVDDHEALTMSMCGLSMDSDDEKGGTGTLNPAADDFRPGWHSYLDGSSIDGGVTLSSHDPGIGNTGRRSGSNMRTADHGPGQRKRPRYKIVRTRPRGRHG